MLSMEHRYNICLMAEKHPKWTQLDLAKWAYETFQLPKIPSQGTVSRLLAKKDFYMKTKAHEKDANRLRKQNNLLVQRILQEWISQSIWNNIPMSTHIMQRTAQAIWLEIPARFREGYGILNTRWINNFLNKMDLNSTMLDGKVLKAPKVWTFEERTGIKSFLENVPQNDIFTINETFLAYNLPLDYAQYESSRIQSRIEIITVMLCSNLTGSEKLNPFIIGRYNNYSSFRNHFPDIPTDRTTSEAHLGDRMAQKFGVAYKSNRKSLLTSNLFHDWLARWDKRLVANNRKVWIVLDDSCPHRIINLHLKNIQLVYATSNSCFLPFNWGILDEFKIRYRIQQYRALIDLQKKIQKKENKNIIISFEQSELTMSNAFKFIKKAWNDIPVESIKRSWKCSGLLPTFVMDNEFGKGVSFKKNEQLERDLAEVCHNFNCLKKWDYEKLIDLNLENKYRNLLNLHELIEGAIVDEFEPEFQLPIKNDSSNEDSSSGLPNKSSSKSQSSTSLGDEVANSLDIWDNWNQDGYEVGFDQFFSTNTNNSKQNKLFNVSTLIDNPDLFLNQFDLSFNVSPSERSTTAEDMLLENLQNNNTFLVNGSSKTPSNQMEIQNSNSNDINNGVLDDVEIDEKLISDISSKFASYDVERALSNNSVTDMSMDEDIQKDEKLLQYLQEVLKYAIENRRLSFSKSSIKEINSNISKLQGRVNKMRNINNNGYQTQVDNTNYMQQYFDHPGGVQTNSSDNGIQF
ncbi:hypothetical protein Kpol_1055p38 [Vanderwaltozyma polyspora DSM 70294]|uniref:HTH CENPB-type domain-containing protein n=1 Tax=Vanderwaltozyma polyspora (strain ATCC 22028 / DSM 70294 / BCRC 21397 / CBS 2163 / NBRC 10782 / NRRL Y-8283 / UCD 57-17) TaxID=436907 RepID=A7TGB3_VANPO|nr:uncharacterized protein Kpol_1055p38 [Vanderwaltozyma polyspora DSM 70294]EDO18683.1 hypothetical protein Kpol_1055p38 [Vanderwaltozyma polyspora DSM 70294]